MVQGSGFSSLSDEERLAQFLDNVEEILDQVVQQPTLFVPGAHGDVAALWEESKQLIPEVQGVLRGQTTDLEGPPPLNARLERAGLTGNSLRLKLGIFGRMWDRLRQRFTPKRIVGVLGVVNSILGSLATALGAAEPLKEAKEIIEGTFDVVADED